MSSLKKIYFIIVAAGGGTRFGGDIPKQFRQLAGKTVVCHSIDTFYRYCKKHGIDGTVILVLSPAGKDFWNAKDAYTYPHIMIADGGDTRAESVSNALKLISSADAESIIMVHDGARPLMSEPLLERLTNAVAEGHTAVVNEIAHTDSLMEKGAGEGACPVCRSNYIAVQTPQAFEAACIMEAYRKQSGDIARMTDDASVVYAATQTPISYVEGETRNIKITNPADLPLAEILLAQCSL